MTAADKDTQSLPAGPAQGDQTAPEPAAGQHPTAELPTARIPAGRARTTGTRTAPVAVATAPDEDGPDGDSGTRPYPAAPARWRRGPGLLAGVRNGLVALAALVVLVVAVAFGGGAVGLWPHLSNPFASRTTDRSQPVVLKSIQDLHRFVGASGNFQVVIDVQKDHRFVPDIILNDRILFVAAGTVDAYVDFSGVNDGALQVDQATKTVTLRLPGARLDTPNIDPRRSYVFAEQQGVVNHIADLFGGDPNKQQQLYVLAQRRIAEAATQSGLVDRAQQNARAMLEQMIKSLGYTTVNIVFVQP